MYEDYEKMNQKRKAFGLDGISGMLIAVVVLLAILVFLVCWAVKIQQNVVDKPYIIKDKMALEKNSKKNKEQFVIKEM